MRFLPALWVFVTLSWYPSSAFVNPSRNTFIRSHCVVRSMTSDGGPAGSFFNPVPEDDGDNDGTKNDDKPVFDERISDILRQRMAQSKASVPSPTRGIHPSEAKGFGIKATVVKKKTVIEIGPPDKPLNDVTNPEYDEKGYTLYADEKTGQKSRVFEALVDYPCEFTMKIVGANEGTFVEDILQVIADSCESEAATLSYSTRFMGKWTSVTVKAPVKNAEMLYMLYENIDRDPRVKFKF